MAAPAIGAFNMSRTPNPSTTSNMVIRYRLTADIRADEGNPRAHKPPQVAAIARSITTFGFNVPILIDASGTVIAGHGRLAAAMRLGLAEVPTIMIEHLSASQRKAYMVADNRLTDLSRWNNQLLGEVLRDLSVAELDFELDAIGFSV